MNLNDLCKLKMLEKAGTCLFLFLITNCREQSLLEKLIVTRLVKKFPALYWTWSFTAVFTRVCHCSLSWCCWIQYTPNTP